MIVSSGAPPVKSPLLRSMTLGMKQTKTGAPGNAAWMTHDRLSASAMPTTSEPAIVIGVVEPPIGMVTKPIGMPASAKTRPASSVPSSLPSGVTVPSSALIGGSARSFSRRAADRERHLHGDLGEVRLDDGHRLHVLAGVGDRQVELVQAAALDRPVLGAHGRPAEVDLGQRVDDAADGRDVVRRGRRASRPSRGRRSRRSSRRS